MLRSELGSGAMGAVYRAKHRLHQRDAAVKILGPRVVTGDTEEDVQRFRREAFARLRHPNCVEIEDIGRLRDVRGKDTAVWWIRMEYVEGTSLEHKLAGGPLLPAQVIELGIQMCAGLQACHEEGIVHRDFKPANVLLTAPQERLKIADFGIAQMTGQPAVTDKGAIMGTPLYMSPEQFRGPQVDARSDLFSLGLVLYEMMTGKRPFERESDRHIFSLMMRVTSEDPLPFDLPADTFPAGLEDIVLRLLRKDPAERFPSAVAVREALLDLETLRVRVFNSELDLSVDVDVTRSLPLTELRSVALARASLSAISRRIVENPKTRLAWYVGDTQLRPTDTVAEALRLGGDTHQLELNLRVSPGEMLGG